MNVPILKPTFTKSQASELYKACYMELILTESIIGLPALLLERTASC